MRFNAIQCDSMRFNAIQCETQQTQRTNKKTITENARPALVQQPPPPAVRHAVALRHRRAARRRHPPDARRKLRLHRRNHHQRADRLRVDRVHRQHGRWRHGGRTRQNTAPARVAPRPAVRASQVGHHQVQPDVVRARKVPRSPPRPAQVRVRVPCSECARCTCASSSSLRA